MSAPDYAQCLTKDSSCAHGGVHRWQKYCGSHSDSFSYSCYVVARFMLCKER